MAKFRALDSHPTIPFLYEPLHLLHTAAPHVHSCNKEEGAGVLL